MTDYPKNRQAGSSYVTEFSIAVNHWKKDSVSFFNVEAWGKLGDIILQFGVKGKQLAISGDLRIDTWEKDGIKHRKTVIKAQSITLLGSKDNDQQPLAKAAPTDDVPF
tara:strand:+ start:16164 stop:16487 length:324 start_codon:yes stop_codon:yes gene_type:complete